jgi:hypothetical protein
MSDNTVALNKLAIVGGWDDSPFVVIEKASRTVVGVDPKTGHMDEYFLEDCVGTGEPGVLSERELSRYRLIWENGHYDAAADEQASRDERDAIRWYQAAAL